MTSRSEPFRDAFARICAVVTVLALGAVTGGQDDRASRASKERLQLLMDRYAAYGFSGSVLVGGPDRVLFHEARGLADREARVAHRPESVFDLASITKQFTSAAVLTLEARGRLELTASLGGLLEDVPQDKRSITVEQLLDHTSGLTKSGIASGGVRSREELARRILGTPLRSPPGARFDYENENYVLLALIVERIVETSFEDFVSRHLFAPAKLEHTGFGPMAGAPGRPATRQYVGHGDRVRAVPVLDGLHRLGAGGVKSTAKDLHRWARSILYGEILPAGARVRLFGDGASGRDGYRFAWDHVRTSSGSRAMDVAGDLEGYQHALRICPRHDRIIVVLCNTRVDRIRWRELVLEAATEVALGGTPRLPVALEPGRANAPELAGRYGLDGGAWFDVVATGARTARISGSGQEAVDALAFRDRPRPELARSLNRRLDEGLEGLVGGSLDDLDAALAPGARRRHARDWEQMTAGRGPLLSHRIMGSVPNGPVRLITFASLRFRRGDPVIVRYYWSGDNSRIVGWAIGRDQAIVLPLFAARPGRWVTLDAHSERRLDVRVERDARGRVRGLRIGRADGWLAASRLR